MCVCYIRLCASKQMFLIKHIVSLVRLMNASSVGEKAAVKGAMGKLSSVQQKEEETAF